MSHNHPTKADEAMFYWLVMQTGFADVTLTEHQAELRMIGQHCRSPVLKKLCSRNAARFSVEGRVLRTGDPMARGVSDAAGF